MKKSIFTVLMIFVFCFSFMVDASTNHQNVIFGAYVKYKSSTEIYVTTGSGRCNDNFWENASETTVNLYSVLPTGEDFLYIYIDDSASSYPTPTFIGSITEPAWSDAKIGWYNGNDRCIGVVWCDSSGNIMQFQNNSSLEYIPTDMYIKQILSYGNPNGDWQTVECTAYTPVNATAIYVTASNKEDDDDPIIVMVSSYENIRAALKAYGQKSPVISTNWISIERGSSRDLKWYGYDNDNSQFHIWIEGFRIER